MLENLIGTVTAGTLARYADTWQRYQLFCSDQSMAVISAYSLLAWRTSLVNADYSPNTINSYLASIKSIMQAALPSGEVTLEEYAAMRAVASVSVRALRSRLRPAKELLSDEELQALVDSIEGDDLQALRDKALIALMATSGARISEVVALRVEHLNIAASKISILGKTDVERREAPASRVALGYVMQWLFARGMNYGWVFTSFQGKSLTVVDRPMTRQAAHDVVKKRAGAQGLDLACHDFRRFVATKLAEGNLSQAQRALGHKSPSTTAGYIKRAPLPTVDWLK